MQSVSSVYCHATVSSRIHTVHLITVVYGCT